MFTVKNTLVGAILTAAGVTFNLFWRPHIPEFDIGLGPMAAYGVMVHVWFLLGHLHLKRLAREGKPAVWPAPSK